MKPLLLIVVAIAGVYLLWRFWPRQAAYAVSGGGSSTVSNGYYPYATTEFQPAAANATKATTATVTTRPLSDFFGNSPVRVQPRIFDTGGPVFGWGS